MNELKFFNHRTSPKIGVVLYSSYVTVAIDISMWHYHHPIIAANEVIEILNTRLRVAIVLLGISHKIVQNVTANNKSDANLLSIQIMSVFCRQGSFSDVEQFSTVSALRMISMCRSVLQRSTTLCASVCKLLRNLEEKTGFLSADKFCLAARFNFLDESDWNKWHVALLF